jgi:ribose transport system substrate-binding protein
MAMFRRRSAVVMLLLAAAVGCTKTPADSGPGGSASSTDSANAGGKKLHIAVIPKGTSHEFWKSVEAGARRAAAENNVEMTFKGPNSEGDTAGQISIVETELANGCDGICLAPLDGKALRKPVTQVIETNVPVVIFDSGLDDMTGATSFVATNNYRAGQHAGKYMAELLGGKGRVVLMRYAINSKSTEEREQGFLDELAKSKEIELISSNKYGGPTEKESLQVGEDYLVNFGDKIDGIFCPNESTTSGMLNALEKGDRQGLAGKIKFVGFDSSDNLVRGLKAGHLKAVVLQDPVQMGYDAVRIMAQKLRGKGDIPAKIEVPEALATTENLNDPKIDKLLHPLKAEK